MSFLFIDDGQTRKARINAVAGMHGQLDFEYRPMLPADVEDLEGRIGTLANRGDHRGASTLAANVFGERLVAWNVRKRDGSEVKPCAAAMSRLPVSLFTKLKSVVEGGRATDTRDDWSPQEWAEYSETGGSVNLETERKNS